MASSPQQNEYAWTQQLRQHLITSSSWTTLTTLKTLTTIVVTTTTATSHHNFIFINHKQRHITSYLYINNSSYNFVFKHQQFIMHLC